VEARLDAGDPWEALFQLACNELPGLYRGMVPFWVFDPEGGTAIERHVPAIPLSQDERRCEDLRRFVSRHPERGRPTAEPRGFLRVGGCSGRLPACRDGRAGRPRGAGPVRP
jgi:hypothetical protein